MDVSALDASRESSLSPRSRFGGYRVGTVPAPRLVCLCDTHRSHWHTLGPAPAPKYFGFFWQPVVPRPVADLRDGSVV